MVRKLSSVEDLISILKEKVKIIDIRRDKLDYPIIRIPNDDICKVSTLLKENFPENVLMLTQVFGVDYPEDKRIELIYSWWDLSNNLYYHFSIDVPYNNPRVRTISDKWEAAIWHERETYEMFGIFFDGNPDMNLPFLLNENMVGEHPLLKSYELEMRKKANKS